MPTEADTCRQLVLPKIYAAGWSDDQIAEQRYFTAGRLVVHGNQATRRPGKRADYLLRITRDTTLAVVEAKASYRNAADGLQQAKDYAQALGLKFAYSTNGVGIVEFDFFTGKETPRDAFPSPDELWKRKCAAEGIKDGPEAERILAPYNLTAEKEPRYYQQIAINAAVQSFVTGKKRALLTLATGTGKTVVAFQTCWKLWTSKWNTQNDPTRKPRFLYLADRTFLVDDPKDKDFAPFGDARYKIENGEISLGREMYFSTYQAIAKDERRPGLYKEFPRDFFDVIIVDECHRGSAKDDSNWREILEYFSSACQLGMTATPMRAENRDSYLYFGNPLYTYSLRQGIDDGYLAPYRVYRIVTEWDATGWRPSQNELDRYKREIPDELYGTPDFERRVALRARTQAVAQHLTNFLKRTNRFAKTIVFCVDQEHALEMKTALNNLNADLVQQYPDYVCRVTADEGDIGKGHMQRFQDIETRTPTILTTSQLLTTGLDAPTCQNVVLVRMVNSMVEFKQIIGRGTRVREDYGKTYFNILDYTGTATQNFADPDFDGEPAEATQEEIDKYGEIVRSEVTKPEEGGEDAGEGEETEDESNRTAEEPGTYSGDEAATPPRKYYFDGGQVRIVAETVQELDADGRQLRVIRLSDYAAEKVRNLCPQAETFRAKWADPTERAEIVRQLAERGIDFQTVAMQAGKPEADPFDLLCHLAYHAPLVTRRQRADRVKRDRDAFFQKFSPQARSVLADLLEKYAADGELQFTLPDVLKVPPLSERGNVGEIVNLFGGADQLRDAVTQLQKLLYAA